MMASDSLDGKCLHEIFELRAKEAPSRIALVDESRSFTYEALNAAADGLALELVQRGVGPEALVGLCAQRSAEYVCGILAVLKAGGGYVPLDPNYPVQRLSFLVSDSHCRIVLVQSAFRDTFKDSGAVILELPSFDAIVHRSRQEVVPPPRRVVDCRNAAYVIYTSGSTGLPKGVIVAHQQVIRLFTVTRDAYRFGPEDTWTLFHSFAFDFSVWEIWGALLFGGRLVIVPYVTSRTPDLLLRLLIEQRVSVLNQTPAAFRGLTAIVSEAGFPQTALRLVIFGGEELDPEILEPWIRGYASQCPRLVNMYGITETTVHVTRCEMHPREPAAEKRSIGRPLADLRVYMLDERMEAVAWGEIGEMYVGGAGVSRGYLRRPRLTAERFVPDPFGPPGSRLYRTGDLAVGTPSGELAFRGRCDDQVQLHGFRIELGEVEGAIDALSGVRGSAAVVQGWGDDARLIAFVVTDSGVTDLRARLERSVPGHMLPSRFVPMSTLPLGPSGKVDRNALRAWDVSGRPYDLIYSAPSGETEKRLARIWGEVLDVRLVGRHDAFTLLGGTSLQATRILARIRREFGYAPPTARFFEASTIASLANLVSSGPYDCVDAFPYSGQLTDQARLTTEASVLATFGQERLYFLAELQEGASVAYNLPVAVRIAGPLDTEVLSAALNDLVGRHDSLRTAFRSTAHGVTTFDDAEVALAVSFRDVSGTASPETFAIRNAEVEAARPFNLSSPPPVRAVLYKLGRVEYLLVLVVHHVAADGRSLALLGDDLTECYEARRARRPPRPRESVPFANFARAQRAADAAGAFEAGVDYWRQLLADTPPTLRLGGLGSSTATHFRGSSLARKVSSDVQWALQRLAVSGGVTRHAVLLAAFALELRRITGQPDLIVGLPADGRPTADYETVVGFFVNTLPVRIRLDGRPSLLDLAGRVHETVLTALDHQHVPFGRILAATDPDHTSVRPLVQVALAYQEDVGFCPRFGGTSTRQVRLHNGTSKFDLVIDVQNESDGMTLTAEYDVNELTRETVQRILDGMLSSLHEGSGSTSDSADNREWPVPATNHSASPTTQELPRYHSEDDATATQIESERILANVFCQVLGVRSVDARSNFFALGGDSITALRAVAGAREQGLQVTVAQLFAHPSIRDLAASHESGAAIAEPTTSSHEAAVDQGELPPRIVAAYPASSLQVGIIYHCMLEEDPTLYHDLVSARIRGRLDVAALQEALDGLIAREDILRTSFDLSNFQEPMQLVRVSMAVPVLLVSSPYNGMDAVRAWWEQAWRDRFDLDEGPLLRCSVITCPDGSYILALSAHHVILDGWSFSVLSAELIQNYEWIIEGRTPEPTVRPALRYRDFVEMERAALSDSESRNFWMDHVDREASHLPLPVVGDGRPELPALEPDLVRVIGLDCVEAAGLYAARLGVPVKTVYLAAHLWALAQLTDSDEAVAGLVFNGRPEAAGADRMLGLFLNSLPIHVRVNGKPWPTLVVDVFEAEQRAMRHRRYPLAQLQRRLAKPLYHARFNYADFHVLEELRGLSALDVSEWWFCDRNEIPLAFELLRRPHSMELELAIRVDKQETSVAAANNLADLFQKALRDMTTV